MLRFDEANELLMEEFEEMKTAFQDDVSGGYGGYEGIQHCFFSENFVPYIVKRLNEGKDDELKSIFSFIEKLFREGDDDLAELAGVSVVEPLYYEPNYEDHKDKIFALSGELTRKSFEDMVDESGEYEKEQITA